MNKKIILLAFIFFNLFGFLLANVKVQYVNSTNKVELETEKINKISYFKLEELNKLFDAKVTINSLTDEIFIELYDETIIAYISSPYLRKNNSMYNFVHPVYEDDKGRYYLPLSSLNLLLPKIEDKNPFNSKNNTILAVFPFDKSFTKIVIDPGHGGKDPGAIGKKSQEKKIVLDIAKKVAEILKEKMQDVEIILTRSQDEFVSLQDRALLANKEKANLFISIHCNSSVRRKNAEGVEVYFLSEAKTNEDRAVEILENSVVEKYEGGETAKHKYDNLEFVLADLTQSEHLLESHSFAKILQNELIKTTGFPDRGVKQANFYVLRGVYMPSVLIELGFLNNPQEEKKLLKRKFQNKVAETIVDAILNFKKELDKI